jgi:hypothetical protein
MCPTRIRKTAVSIIASITVEEQSLVLSQSIFFCSYNDSLDGYHLLFLLIDYTSPSTPAFSTPPAPKAKNNFTSWERNPPKTCRSPFPETCQTSTPASGPTKTHTGAVPGAPNTVTMVLAQVPVADCPSRRLAPFADSASCPCIKTSRTIILSPNGVEVENFGRRWCWSG